MSPPTQTLHYMDGIFKSFIESSHIKPLLENSIFSLLEDIEFTFYDDDTPYLTRIEHLKYMTMNWNIENQWKVTLPISNDIPLGTTWSLSLQETTYPYPNIPKYKTWYAIPNEIKDTMPYLSSFIKEKLNENVNISFTYTFNSKCIDIHAEFNLLVIHIKFDPSLEENYTEDGRYTS